MQNSYLELEERRRVEGPKMQTFAKIMKKRQEEMMKQSCWGSIRLEETRRVEGTRMQSSCLELEKKEEELREQGCRTVPYS